MIVGSGEVGVDLDERLLVTLSRVVQSVGVCLDLVEGVVEHLGVESEVVPGVVVVDLEEVWSYFVLIL